MERRLLGYDKNGLDSIVEVGDKILYKPCNDCAIDYGFIPGKVAHGIFYDVKYNCLLVKTGDYISSVPLCDIEFVEKLK